MAEMISENMAWQNNITFSLALMGERVTRFASTPAKNLFATLVTNHFLISCFFNFACKMAMTLFSLGKLGRPPLFQWEAKHAPNVLHNAMSCCIHWRERLPNWNLNKHCGIINLYPKQLLPFICILSFLNEMINNIFYTSWIQYKDNKTESSHHIKSIFGIDVGVYEYC